MPRRFVFLSKRTLDRRVFFIYLIHNAKRNAYAEETRHKLCLHAKHLPPHEECIFPGFAFAGTSNICSEYFRALSELKQNGPTFVQRKCLMISFSCVATRSNQSSWINAYLLIGFLSGDLIGNS
jgi:hypothetical protein